MQNCEGLLFKPERPSLRILLAIIALLVGSQPARAETALVAVAANFLSTAELLADAFAETTEHEIRFSSGPTGQLYAQIAQGAPFDVLLSADAERPQLAIAEGLAVEDTDFTFAVGILVLYAPSLDLRGGEHVLLQGQFSKLAIADPIAAPYGAAALEVLAVLDPDGALAPKLVTGASVAQALQFIDSGNAELGFVAFSQVVTAAPRHVWIVPEELHAPIRQDAVLLVHGQGNAAARAFLQFLQTPRARRMITAAGYGLPPDGVRR